MPTERILNPKAKAEKAAEAARFVSEQSRLPGLHNGPADAYRHIIWAGEVTRIVGETTARLILWGHEMNGRLRQGQPKDEEAMDFRNNELGIQIGRTARSFKEVIIGARKIIEASDRRGHGLAGAKWLDQSKWQADEGRPHARWPDIDWSASPSAMEGYTLGGEEQSYLPSASEPDLMEAEGWMQRSQVNPNHFVIDFKKKAEIDRARTAAGGTVHVDGYTQMRAGKPVDVSDHMRSAPAR